MSYDPIPPGHGEPESVGAVPDAETTISPLRAYEVTLRPAVSGGPNRIRRIQALSLRDAQERAVDRWPMGDVFHVRELREEETS